MNILLTNIELYVVSRFSLELNYSRAYKFQNLNFLHLDYTTLVCGGVETELMWQAYTLAYINITKKSCHSVLFSYTSVPSVHTIITSYHFFASIP